MNNTLLTCPDCLAKGVKNTLGSVDAYGQLVVLRYRHGKVNMLTTIQSIGEYMVICHCGFGTAIHSSNGHATHGTIPPLDSTIKI